MVIALVQVHSPWDTTHAEEIATIFREDSLIAQLEKSVLTPKTSALERCLVEESCPDCLGKDTAHCSKCRKHREFADSSTDYFPFVPERVAVSNFKAKLSELSQIPKLIHVSWAYKFDITLMAAKSRLIKLGLFNLKQLNPEWKIVFYDDNAIKKELKSWLPANDWELLRSCHIVEMCDLWRLLKMYYSGGVYTDIDAWRAAKGPALVLHRWLMRRLRLGTLARC
jgi:mannosyltransferase OCH1-like enzyme